MLPKLFLKGLHYAHLFLRWVAVAFLLVTVVNQFFLTSFQVDGHSMDPTLDDDQWLLVDKITKYVRPIVEGEVVIVRYSGDPRVKFVKRVIGTPNTRGVVDGVEYVLGPEQYFVVGDNRKHSTDSRDYGPIVEKDIIGRVIGY